MSTEQGWVIVSPIGLIFDSTWKRTRTDSIESWNKIWQQPNWRRDRRKGYRCVKAKRTIEIL